MKRSSSAPCLADEGTNGSKKAKEESNDEPTGREYLQLALARVLELQRQVKDETYTTDNTSDLGESDSEEDVMREVLVKVFKDLPGSSPAVTSIINRATRSQPQEVRTIRDKRVQLSGYDTCRRVALEFMNTVVKSTPLTEYDMERFEMGTFSKTETKIADHRTGLTENGPGRSTDENSKWEMKKNLPKNLTTFSQISSRGGIAEFGCNKEFDNNLRNFSRSQASGSLSAEGNANNINLGINQMSRNRGNRLNYFQDIQNPNVVSRDYEIRVRMLKGLDLHLATKQRDFTARLMRQ